jgi:hypothetical protein
MSMMNRKLKNLLIEPALQLKLMSYFFGIFIFTILSLYFVNFYFFWTLKEKAIAVGIPVEHVFFTYLRDQKGILDTLFFVLSFVNLLILAIVGFFISHRIAGPFYKIKKHLSEMTADSADLKLRKHDFLKDIEPVVNELKNRLK